MHTKCMVTLVTALKLALKLASELKNDIKIEMRRNDIRFSNSKQMPERKSTAIKTYNQCSCNYSQRVGQHGALSVVPYPVVLEV